MGTEVIKVEYTPGHVVAHEAEPCYSGVQFHDTTEGSLRVLRH